MPLNLNVGVAKKLGQPEFGSLGASCSIQVELPHDIIFRDLEAFHCQVRNAYAACAQAVNDELARHQQAANTAAPNGQIANGNGNGHAASNGHANGQHANGNGRTATNMSEKQLSYARQLAKGIQGLGIRGLESLSEKMFGKSLVALTTLDASGLIDMLKAVKDGRIDINAVLGQTAA